MQLPPKSVTAHEGSPLFERNNLSRQEVLFCSVLALNVSWHAMTSGSRSAAVRAFLSSSSPPHLLVWKQMGVVHYYTHTGFARRNGV